jgi:hypothetical protein
VHGHRQKPRERIASVLTQRESFTSKESDMTTATHVEDEVLWSLSPALRENKIRIYSGRSETIVLTLTVLNPIPPAGAVTVELRRNGGAVPDGVINKLNAVISRTWFLTGVKTLDLVTRDKVYCSGSYAISVILPGT